MVAQACRAATTPCHAQIRPTGNAVRKKPTTDPCQALATMRADRSGKRSNRPTVAVRVSNGRARFSTAARSTCASTSFSRRASAGLAPIRALMPSSRMRSGVMRKDIPPSFSTSLTGTRPLRPCSSVRACSSPMRSLPGSILSTAPRPRSAAIALSRSTRDAAPDVCKAEWKSPPAARARIASSIDVCNGTDRLVRTDRHSAISGKKISARLAPGSTWPGPSSDWSPPDDAPPPPLISSGRMTSPAPQSSDTPSPLCCLSYMSARRFLALKLTSNGALKYLINFIFNLRN